MVDKHYKHLSMVRGIEKNVYINKEMKVYNFKGNPLTIIGDVNYHIWFKFRDIQRILGCSKRSLKYIDEKDIKRFNEICEYYPNEVSANEYDATIYI